MRATGLDAAMRTAVARWTKPAAVHDPAKTCTDIAIALALGGGCLADAALLRAERPHPGAQLRITDADGNRMRLPLSVG